MYLCSPPRFGALVRVISLSVLLTLAMCPVTLGADKVAQSFTAKTFDGQDFDLDQYLGKVPIVLDFGSIYCSSCVQSIPHFIVQQNEYADKLKVVGVNLDTYGLSRVKRFFGTFSNTLNFPVLIDKGLKISRQFEILTLPSYVFIDKEGKIVSTIVGYDSEKRAKMDRLIKQLVEGGPLEDVAEAPADDVTLLVPEQFTMTYQSKITVVGLTGGNPGPFKVRLNGGSEREAKSYGDKMFYTRIPLSLGSNFIEVRYPKGSGMGTIAVVMFREPRMGEGLGVNFPEYQFHLAEKEERCSPCHEMTPEDPEGGMAMDDFCTKCHGYQIDEKFVHGPIAMGGCAMCHDYKSEPHHYDRHTTGSELCFNCHDDIRGAFDRDFIHGPVAMGMCVVCHSPHSSSFKFQLNNTQSSLCTGCHEDVKAKLNKFKPHAPVMEENCTGCHDPHASDNPSFFLKGVGVDLCLNCHSEAEMKRHTHPTEGSLSRKIPGITPDEDGNININCQTCHDPHSSDEDKLFTVTGGCSACH